MDWKILLSQAGQVTSQKVESVLKPVKCFPQSQRLLLIFISVMRLLGLKVLTIPCQHVMFSRASPNRLITLKRSLREFLYERTHAHANIYSFTVNLIEH